MCGISGFVDPSINVDGQQEQIIEAMLKSIAHRGPDNTAHWSKNEVVLGHNRLSILDLSESANQPFIRNKNTLVYNGEVYNYVEIRAKLIQLGHRFTTDSDTEVVLAAYEEWGSDCVTHFVGMWAFALWDEKEQHLFCSRDRFGIKPFYYIQEGNKFYFGSEYKALKKSPLFCNTPNLKQIYCGLQLGWISYGSETYFENLHQLPQACSLIFKKGQLQILPYWEIDSIQTNKLSLKEATLHFQELFLDSIRLHMRSDVVVGGCLSGGIDSSSIASCVGKLFPKTPFNTYTIFFDGKNEVDERPFAKEVVKAYPTLQAHYYQPNNQDVISNFEQVMDCQEVPIAGSSPISQYFVMKLAAEHKAKVLLDGQGADEYLAGYMHSFYRLIGGSFRNLQLKKGLEQHKDYVKLQGFKAKESVTRLLKSMLSSVWKEQQLSNFEYNNFYTFLPNTKESTFVSVQFVLVDLA